ncbi:MAG: DUF11 domain-containing protein [Candidatus Eisenbacteria bacterium]|uniref:DUF11 domain-containing protein n=1 Tax=Eiseniibacteriota bacterium TaxID=2212470 RepID=A0A933SEA5_UNCEI|nr:DUF11 domain-containing protein [Candidatus Eisenbacteria bacterium]
MTARSPHREAARDAHARIRAWALGLVALAPLLALAPLRAHAAMPPAGTPVDNTATATAHVVANGVWVNPASNTVRTVVQALDAVTLRYARSLLASPGETIAFAHVLAHAGNTNATYTLTLAQDGADGFDLSAPALLRDVDGDGVPSGPDTPIANGATVTLARGDSLALLVTGTVPANAPAFAHARVTLAAATPGGTRDAVTDTVRTGAAGAPPALAFWSAGFGTVVRSSALGAPLHVQAEAAACNTNPALRDTVALTLSSRLTGDSDVFLAIETGPNTGVFRTPPTPVTQSPPVSAPANDGVLMQSVGDEVEALLTGCGGAETRAHVWIQPGGVVFDARSDAPVAFARVALVDLTGAGNGGAPGGPARVLDWDGVSAAPSEVVTDASGRFEFPSVAASTYAIRVTPPATHTFPSTVPLPALSANRTLDAAGSYGGAFAISRDGDPVRLDVPVDGVVTWALFAEKTASKLEAEWGDLLEYRVNVANRSDSALAAVTLRDRLPHGFAYVRGTARVNGAAAEPATDTNGALTFALGAMATGDRTEIRYGVRVGAGAPEGDAINRAIAAAGTLESNEATARVRVRGDAFGGEALLTGTVWYDADRDGVRGPGEGGLPGVRLYLDDGSFAVTDEHGRWSMAGLSPRTHALKLDGTTLPPTARAAATHRHERDTPGLRFVTLTRGELARADFAVTGDTTASRQVRERQLASATANEAARVLQRGLSPLAPRAPVGDTRALPAARVTSGESAPAPERTASGDVASPATGGVEALPAATSPALALEQLLPALEPALGFVGIGAHDTIGVTQLSVVAKAPFGSRVALRVNGMPLPDSRVGRHFTAPRTGVEAWEYIGVALQSGDNTLELSVPRTGERVIAHVVAPGPFARLELHAPRRAHADGRAVVPVEVRVTDRDGVPIAARTIVTLEAGAARFAAPDLDPVTPGWQTAIEGGRARVALLAPASPGESRVVATSGDVRAAATIAFVPELRPMLAVGALEGVLRLRRYEGAAGAAGASGARVAGGAARLASFEAPVTQFTTESRDGRTAADAHGALFMKGRVQGDLLLTLGWDSDREREQRQFRDLTPDRGFPVAGDAATRGYEAQSTGQLYAKLERRDASLLYGDYVTGSGGGGPASSFRSLGRYGRSLTGALASWERGALAVHTFTSRDRAHRAVEELRGMGTSGPYVLAHAPLVENSERVELIVRDRAQPSIVRSSTSLQRFTDYTLEPLTGRLLLRAPAPSLDADLNTVWLRVSYERDGDGAPAWVHGADARVRVHPRLELGGVAVDDHDPAAPYELRSASAEWRAGAHTALAAEWAATRHVGEAAADAGRVELTHESPRGTARAWGVSTAPRFDNPSAGAGAGRNEAGATLALRLPDRSRLAMEALFSGDAEGRERRAGGLLSLDRALSTAVRGEFGVRVAGVTRRDAASDPTTASVRARLSAQWPKHPEWSGYSELEQDTRAWERRMAAVGGEYRFTARGRLYARHELLSSLSSAWAMSNTQSRAATVVGVDADVAHDAHVFSEYRMSDVIAGREGQAAVGLRNGWKIADGMRLSTTFERVTPLAGSDAGPTTALTGAVDFTGDDVWKGSSRFEVRTSRASDQFLQGMAAAVRLDSAWTALGRQLLTLTRTHGAGAEARERLQLGFAWRPNGPYEALGRWEFRYDREAPNAAAGIGRVRHVANIAALSGSATKRAWEGTLGWAGKLTREQESARVTAGGAQWVHGRIARALGAHWDAGVTGSVRAGRTLAEREYGLGAEVGRELARGAWLSLGFNRFGFDDDELAGESWTRAGAYLRVRMRFDERTFANEPEVRP